jgi:hypothetical protein
LADPFGSDGNNRAGRCGVGGRDIPVAGGLS